MSCYTLPATDPNRFTCRVGWDNGVSSFFIYVARPLLTRKDGRIEPECDGHVIRWVGTGDGQIPTLEDLEREIEGYATLPEETRLLLWDDQRRANENIRVGACLVKPQGSNHLKSN